MTEPLPPELAQLYARYDQLVDATAGGAMSMHDAMIALRHLEIPDAHGALWGIDDTGTLVRRMTPNDPPVPADPRHYQSHAPHSAPSSGEQFVSVTGFPHPPTGGPPPRQPGGPVGPAGPPMAHYPPPPTGFDSPGGGYDPVLPQPYPVPSYEVPAGYGMGGPTGPGYDMDGYGPPPPTRNNPLKQLTGLVGKRGTKSVHTAGQANPVWGRIAARKRLLAIAAGCLGVIVVITQTVGSHTPTSGGLPTTTPATSTSHPVTSSVPTGDDMASLITALGSGQRTQASSVIIQPGSPAHIAEETARFFGYAQSQLSIISGPAAKHGAGALARWQLRDTTNHGVILASITVSLLASAHGWRLTTWPAFNA